MALSYYASNPQLELIQASGFPHFFDGHEGSQEGCVDF